MNVLDLSQSTRTQELKNTNPFKSIAIVNNLILQKPHECLILVSDYISSTYSNLSNSSNIHQWF